MTEKEQNAAGASGEQKETQSNQTPSQSPVVGLTEAQVREIVRRESQSLVAQEANKAFGGMQRWRKEVEQKTKAFDDLVGRLTKSGKIPEDTDLSAVRQEYLGEAIATLPDAIAETEQEKPDTSETGKTERTPQNDPVWFTASLVADEYGLAEGDPELGELVTDKGPVKYIESVVAAAQKKAQRLAKTGDGGDVELENLVPTDMGTGKSSKSNPLADINDPDKLLEMGLYPDKK